MLSPIASYLLLPDSNSLENLYLFLFQNSSPELLGKTKCTKMNELHTAGNLHNTCLVCLRHQ